MKFIYSIMLACLAIITQSYGKGESYILTAESPTINEDVGTYNINVRIEPKLAPGDTITVYYQTQNGTATAGSDFLALNSSKPINNSYNEPKYTNFTIPLTILDDAIGGEGNEYFYFKVTNATSNNSEDTITISPDGGLVTIIDNETAALPRLSIANMSVDETAGTADFTVTLNEPATEDISFAYTTIDDTATGGSDYTITSSTATILTGSSSTTVSIPIINDLMANEGSETFFVYLSNAVNAVLLDFEGVGTIIDDDTALSLAINDASIAEGDVDKTVNVKINFSAPLPSPIMLTYHTSQGTATADVDYTEVSSETVTVPMGAKEHNLTLTILGDTLIENAENFFITINSVTGTTPPVIADGNSTVTIFDNDGTGGCSSYVGLMTINEYQNNPHYFESRGGGNVKVIGNYVEIKYIDFLVKKFVTDDWSVTVYTTAGTQGILWKDQDPECLDPRYEVFQFSNNVMGAQGYVVLRDQNGNEVDVLNIDNSNHYSQQCQNFIYDTDFDSSAQNKDLFREPDGTGDWYDHGTGANSGGSRCINKDGVNLGLIFTEFDAIDTDEPIPSIVQNYASVPIKTKITDKPFDLNILSIDTNTGGLKNSSVTIKAYLADAMGNKLVMQNGSAVPGIDVAFNGMSSVEISGFLYDKAIRQARVMFEYCENNASGGITDWDQCYLDPEKELDRRHAYSRNIFAIRPDHFEIGISHTDAPNLLRAGETYSASLTARDYSGNPVVGYTVTGVGSFSFNDMLDINHTAYFKDGPADEDGVLHGNFTNVSSAPFYSIDGLTSVSSTTKPANAEEVLDVAYSDVGKVTLHVYDKVWASIDNDDTPLDCNGTFICGDLNVSFIPHHFVFAELNITNHAGPDNNFTYVANERDLMSAKVQTRIEAVTKDGNITQNFHTGSLYYENNVSVVFSVTVPPSDEPNGYFYPNANESNITNQMIGFGSSGLDSNGTRNILWDESTYPLEFNFNREINQPANPFDVNGSCLAIRVYSNYIDPSDSDTAEINGSRVGDWNATQSAQCLADEACLRLNAEESATFFYARTRPSKLFYPDVTESSITTPIFIDVYCDLGHDACGNFGIDTVNAQITEYEWWLALNHRMDRDDGNVTLLEGNITEGSSADWDVLPKVVAINDSEGEDDAIVVSRGSGPVLPLTVEIDLDTADPADTSGWLIYNPNDNEPPIPFYQVRFIGQSGWAGHGKTGHVVETNSSAKKNKRVEW